MFTAAEHSIANGATIVILSDRGVSPELAPIPALLAVAGLHHHLIRAGLRGRCGLVLESGEPREVHHFSLLISYGCSAVNPYLAYDTIDDLIAEKMLLNTDHKTAVKKFIKASIKGVVKTMAKMGISTIQSYRGAQVFEAIGINQAVVDKYFTWTATRIEGIGLEVIAEEALKRHAHAFPAREVNGELDAGGQYPMARGWRAASVQSADDSQIADRLPPQQREGLSRIRRTVEQPGYDALHLARPARFAICRPGHPARRSGIR